MCNRGLVSIPAQKYIEQFYHLMNEEGETIFFVELMDKAEKLPSDIVNYFKNHRSLIPADEAEYIRSKKLEIEDKPLDEEERIDLISLKNLILLVCPSYIFLYPYSISILCIWA